MKKLLACSLLGLMAPLFANAAWLGCYQIPYVQLKSDQNAWIGGSERKYVIPLNQAVEDTIAKLNGPNKDKIQHLCLSGSKDGSNLYVWSASVADLEGHEY